MTEISSAGRCTASVTSHEFTFVCVSVRVCVSGRAVEHYTTSNAICIILAAPSLPIEGYAASLDAPESPC